MIAITINAHLLGNDPITHALQSIHTIEYEYEYNRKALKLN